MPGGRKVEICRAADFRPAHFFHPADFFTRRSGVISPVYFSELLRAASAFFLNIFEKHIGKKRWERVEVQNLPLTV